ncbi:MAG TPA: cytidylate kinase [Candidatus Woesearchaeota archaeon]|nr:cytidylate kinase [Candidatus Woesearchaeota archaeon]
MGTFIKRIREFEKNMEFEKKGLTVTVSGLSGSGKTAFARALSESLKLKLVQTGDIFREIAGEQGKTLEEVSKSVLEQTDIEADVRTLKLAKKGNIVIVGRLAGWAAGDNADLKIWIDVDFETKARRVANRDNKSIEEAKKDLIKRDEEDTMRYQKLYGINQKDLSIYDVLINNTELS